MGAFLVIPNAILLSQTLFLCECEIVVPVIKLQMEGAPPKYFINYSPTIPHQTQLFHNYSTTFYYSTLQSFSKPNSSGCRHKLVHSLVAIRWFTLILSVDLPMFGPWTSHGTPGCLPRQTIGFVVWRCMYTVSWVKTNPTEPTMQDLHGVAPFCGKQSLTRFGAKILSEDFA